MAHDAGFRCPGCGSLLTHETSIPGAWECRYCACLFPVDIGRDVQAKLPVPDPGPSSVS